VRRILGGNPAALSHEPLLEIASADRVEEVVPEDGDEVKVLRVGPALPALGAREPTGRDLLLQQLRGKGGVPFPRGRRVGTAAQDLGLERGAASDRLLQGDVLEVLVPLFQHARSRVQRAHAYAIARPGS
jgi:hypothetical protein